MPISGPRQIYITGASGALGNRLMSLLNSSSSAVKAIAIPRDSKGCYVPALCEEEQSISHGENLRFVVHCGWNTKDRSPESQESCGVLLTPRNQGCLCLEYLSETWRG